MSAIDHCMLRDEMKKHNMTADDFNEAVMDRVGQIIEGIGKPTKNGSGSSEFLGVEIVAQAVAAHVVDEGAKELAQDMGVELSDLKDLAASAHISFC